MKKCSCCTEKSNPPKPFRGIGYNYLTGETRQWAKDNQIPSSEFTVRVKGGKKFGGPEWQKRK